MPTSTFRGATPDFTASAAAVPAACPIAMQGGITRIAAAATDDADTHRPATSRLSTFCGTRHLYGTPYQSPFSIVS